MPTYQYACTECGHGFEAVQSFSDDALTECPQCTGRLRKVFNSVGIVFKGSGFYRTDSREKPAEKSGDKTGAGKESSGKESSGKDAPSKGKDGAATTGGKSSGSDGASIAKPAAAGSSGSSSSGSSSGSSSKSSSTAGSAA